MELSKEVKDIPHMIIRKVARTSHSHMEEFVKGFGNVDRIYYSKSENDYPHMFVVFTKESSLYRAYVRISENFQMYDVSLKPLVPKSPMYCLECMRESYYFCESCSAPYCSEACQKIHWPEHALKCVSIPKLVQMQWHENEEEALAKQFTVNASDQVVIVGYYQGIQGVNASVTIRMVGEDKDREYLDFLQDCNAEAERSPAPDNLVKETKVWALFRDQWYRGKVEATKGKELSTVHLMDLCMSQDIQRSNIRLLQSKEMFFRPMQTKSFRLKGIRQNDILAVSAVRNRLEQAVLNMEKFTVTDNNYNYIDLQLDGKPQSLNRHLLILFERMTGIEELEPVVVEDSPTKGTATVHKSAGQKLLIDRISYPQFDEMIEKPNLYVFRCVSDGLNWSIYAVNLKYMKEMGILSKKVNETGKATFSTTPALKSFAELEQHQLCLIRVGPQFDRCQYIQNATFESIDIGQVYDDVKLENIRLLPRELIAHSYMMVLLVDDEFPDDFKEMEKRLADLKNCPVKSIDQLIYTKNNIFRCNWKKVLE